MPNENREHDLEALYRTYAAGKGMEALSPAEWLWVDELLYAIAQRAVRAAAGRFKIPTRTVPEVAESVRHELREKWFKKRFSSNGGFMGLLRTAAFRDVISVLRKIKSVLPGSLDAVDEDITVASAGDPETADSFDLIRSLLPDSRWPEYPMARTVVLAHIVATSRAPGAAVLRPIVPAKCRKAVYVSAVVDVNTAIEAIRCDQTAA